MPDKKRTAELDWQDIRYFVALSRHGSLSATARALRVNHATVARRVENLETRLGRPLFERRPDGYALTAQGRAVLDAASAMDEAALSVLRRLDTGAELKGLVRLTAGRTLSDGFLIDRLDKFHVRYPAVDLELIGEARIMSLARREADIALRFGTLKDSDLIARRIGTIAFGLYASPACRDRIKAGAMPAFIGFDEDGDSIAEASWLTRQFGDARFSFRTNNQMSQAAAARAGYGVALLPRYLAARDPGVVQVALGKRLPTRDVWLLMRRELQRVPRVRAVADYLVELFRREQRLLAG
jgi:DNA-binding transcriptional LysR family regulator